MPYSLPVRCNGWPAISTVRVSRLTDSFPVRMIDSEYPFDRRAIAWMRAISSALSNGLVR